MSPAKLILILQLFWFATPALSQRVSSADHQSIKQNIFHESSVIPYSRSLLTQNDLSSQNGFQAVDNKAGIRNGISEMHIAKLSAAELFSLRSEKEIFDYNLVSPQLERQRPLMINVLRIIGFILNAACQ